MSDAGDDIQAPKGKLSVEEALQQVLKNALCAKALDKRQAHLCVLVETCTEPSLCAEHKINLIKVGDAKIVGCSCVVVKDFGSDSEGLHVVLDYFKNR
ncbi:hypothetical protein BDZ89DRAFT_1104719 [Hymenopellis radicata]|nr:hypothetical protein BDZ89DRAFT_1104719 [Hymenopellis radicata]